MTERPSRALSTFAVALITLGAFGLRAYLLDVQSLWYDEGVTAEVARRGITELTRWTAHDIQPPLYYYVVAAWGRLAGWSEWSLRFPSVFFGTLIPPLLAATALALTRRRSASILAALFGALHPLLLYYSQEARMYAMLTALGVLLAYLVVHAESGIMHRWLHWATYVAVATAAIYTHYFAFFLLFALSVAFFIDQLILLPYLLRRRNPDIAPASAAYGVVRGPLLAFLAANAAVLLLYVPWLMALFRQLALDTSYWEGAFKLGEAVRHIGNSFIGGETMLETQATALLIPYALMTVALLPALLWRNPSQWRAALYSVLWLAAPIAAVLFLASMAPKFNARYVMIALPGLLLLWAAGLVELSAFSNWNLLRGFRSFTAAPRSTVAIILTLAILAGFVHADRNWFTDPAFTKSEWRELSQYVRSQIKRGPTGEADGTDQIILVSGHAWPVWNYYAPDLPPLRLPELEILDVNAVLDFASSAVPLRNALLGKEDVWLIQWQEKVVDPMNIVPLQLNLAGREERVKAPFWQLGLRHYTAVNAEAVLVEPTEISERSVNFGNEVYLLDYTLADNGDLLLFWQIHPDHSDPMPDLHIAGETVTTDGLPVNRLQDRRLASYEYPTFRWRVDQITLGRVFSEDWVGASALPNDYRMRLSVYDAEGDLTGLDVIGPEGQPLGKHITLDLTLPVATEGPDYVNEVTFAQLITDLFAEFDLAAEQAEPGQLVQAEIRWYAEEKPPGDYDLLVRWRLRDSDEIVEQETLSLSNLPTSQWPDDELMRTAHALRPPLGIAPGDYWLEIGVTAPESTFIRVPFRVLRSTRIFQPPPIRTPIEQNFGESLHLRGIMEPIRTEMQPQDQVALTFVWQATDRIAGDYSVTLQWLDEQGRPAAQTDLALPGGSSNWLPGQVELQTFFAAAPQQPGAYRLVTAVYDANLPDLPRLHTERGQDLIELQQVTISAN